MRGPAMIDHAFGLICALLLAAVSVYSSLVLARRLLPKAPSFVRFSGAAIVFYALLATGFQLLIFSGYFNLMAALVLWTAIGWGTNRLAVTGVVDEIRGAKRAAVRHVKFLRRTGLWLLVLPAIMILAARLARGLVAPPLAWDALTYHLVKAARWVQTGAYHLEDAPAAWSYYKYFPPLGDCYWAWAMLPTRSDALLAVAGIAIWVTCYLGGYSMARALHCSRFRSVLAASAIAFVPAVVNFVTSAYVDNVSLSSFLLGAGFLVLFYRAPSWQHALLCGMGFGMGAGVKHIALPIAALSVIMLALISILRMRSWKFRAGLVASAVVGTCIGVPPLIATAADTGNPLYPLALEIKGFFSHPGNLEFYQVHTGAFATVAMGNLTLMRWLNTLFFPQHLQFGVEVLNLGPASALVVVLAILGLKGAAPLPKLFLLVSAIIYVSSFLTEIGQTQITLWSFTSARLLLPAYAVAVILCAAGRPRICAVALAITVATNLVLTIPLGWSLADGAAVMQLSGAVLLASLICVLIARSLMPPFVKRLGFLACMLIPFLALYPIRRQWRYIIYEAAANERSYDVHPLGRNAKDWPIWQFLDQQKPLRVAMAGGLVDAGQNWYRYPLLGSNLQNMVLYVSPTMSGFPDYRTNGGSAGADFDVWVGRLNAERVQFVTLMGPPVIEHAWAAANPQLFKRVPANRDWTSIVYEFHSR